MRLLIEYTITYLLALPVDTDHGKYTIDIEGELNEDIYIYNNHFLNLPTPLHTMDNTYGPSETRRVYFYYNILENCGWNHAAKYDTCINIYNTDIDSVFEDIFIYNNVIESTVLRTQQRLQFYTAGTQPTL